MDRMDLFVTILLFILWLPLFIPAVACWFYPDIAFGHKVAYTVAVLAIWIPPIVAWIDTHYF